MRPTDDELNRAVAGVLGVDLYIHGPLGSLPCLPEPYCSNDAPTRLIWPLIEKVESGMSSRTRIMQQFALRPYTPSAAFLVMMRMPRRKIVEGCLKALGAWRKDWTDE